MNSSTFVGSPTVRALSRALALGIWVAGYTSFAADGTEASTSGRIQTHRSEQRLVLTGSHIPKKIKDGRQPASATPLVIIDRKAIERSGANTLIGLLHRTGNSR